MSGLLSHERWLEALSGLSEIVRAEEIASELAIAPTENKLFVVTTESGPSTDREGVVLGVAFDWEGILSTSPVTLVEVGGDSTLPADKLLGPWKSNARPIAAGVRALPFPVFVRPEKNVALALKNNEGAAYTAKGAIFAIWWSRSQAVEVRRRLAHEQLVTPWPQGEIYAQR